MLIIHLNVPSITAVSIVGIEVMNQATNIIVYYPLTEV